MLVIFDVEVIFGFGICIPICLVRVSPVSCTHFLEMILNNLVGGSYSIVVIGL